MVPAQTLVLYPNPIVTFGYSYHPSPHTAIPIPSSDHGLAHGPHGDGPTHWVVGVPHARHRVTLDGLRGMSRQGTQQSVEVGVGDLVTFPGSDPTACCGVPLP